MKRKSEEKMWIGPALQNILEVGLRTIRVIIVQVIATSIWLLMLQQTVFSQPFHVNISIDSTGTANQQTGLAQITGTVKYNNYVGSVTGTLQGFTVVFLTHQGGEIFAQAINSPEIISPDLTGPGGTNIEGQASFVLYMQCSGKKGQTPCKAGTVLVGTNFFNSSTLSMCDSAGHCASAPSITQTVNLTYSR